MTEKNSVTCDDFADTLADLLERDVPEPVRAAMEAHALACTDCGPLLADLRKLRLDAANLPELAPSRDLWAGIAERIETPVVAIGGSRGEGVAPRRRSWITTGLAAAALVGVTATTTYLLTKQTNSAAPGSASPKPIVMTASTSPAAPVTASTTADKPAVPQDEKSGNRPANAPTATLASNRPTAEQTYDLEISRLRKIVDRRRNDLDSATVAVLEKNLKIIDNAIAQCRVALEKDPASSYLHESLNDALDDKVKLLRTAAGLPSKM